MLLGNIYPKRQTKPNQTRPNQTKQTYEKYRKKKKWVNGMGMNPSTPNFGLQPLDQLGDPLRCDRRAGDVMAARVVVDATIVRVGEMDELHGGGVARVLGAVDVHGGDGDAEIGREGTEVETEDVGAVVGEVGQGVVGQGVGAIPQAARARGGAAGDARVLDGL